MRLCKDCRWMRASPAEKNTPSVWQCVSPENKMVSPLTGAVTIRFVFCHNARWDSRACGEMGNWWEVPDETIPGSRPHP